jgi:hypothetical protein
MSPPDAVLSGRDVKTTLQALLPKLRRKSDRRSLIEAQRKDAGLECPLLIARQVRIFTGEETRAPSPRNENIEDDRFPFSGKKGVSGIVSEPL